MDRRQFLKTTGLVSAASLLAIPKAQAEDALGITSLSIIQGPTNESTTQIAVDIPKKALKVRYAVKDLDTQRVLNARVTGSFSKSFALERVDHLRIDDLELGHRYQLQVFDEKNVKLEEREFGALDTNKQNARIAHLSCMYDLIGMNISTIWASVQASRPDVIFLLGDNCYGDVGGVLFGPQLLWSRYIQTRKFLPFYRWKKLVPTFAIWDDHDFGKNNTDGNYIHKKDSLETFKSFYAQEEIAGFFRPSVGCSSAFDLFGQRFLLLDGRYWRLMKSRVGKGFFGDEQMDWIIRELGIGTNPVMMACGSQFFGGYMKGECLEWQSPADFDQLNKEISKANRPMLFASGDVHFSEIMQIKRSEFGFDGIEITSSGMHSLSRTSLPTGNTRRLAAAMWNNFVCVDYLNGRALQAVCFGLNITHFTQSLQL